MKLPLTFRPLSVVAIATLSLASLAGCQQHVVSELHGKWVGHPDTAAARASREAEKYGDELTDEPTDEGAESESIKTPRHSDWESYDVTIQLDFVSPTHIEMSLGDETTGGGEQPVAGKWHVVSTAPASCIIEVVTPPQTGESSEPVRRRFELLLDERDGALDGFSLTEVGADRQQGAIYFRRSE